MLGRRCWYSNSSLELIWADGVVAVEAVLRDVDGTEAGHDIGPGTLLAGDFLGCRRDSCDLLLIQMAFCKILEMCDNLQISGNICF